MRTVVLSAVLCLLVVATPVVAQDSFEFRTDFEGGQEFRYQMTAVSLVHAPTGEPQTSKTQATYTYEIVSADEHEFTLRSRLDEYSVVLPDGQTFEIPAAILEVVRSIEVTYDRQWNVVAVRGFGRFVKDLFRQADLPGELGTILGEGLETILGPMAKAFVEQSSGQSIQKRLFDQGTVRVGDEWKTAMETALTRTEMSGEVTSIGSHGGRRVCRTLETVDMEYVGFMKIFGYEKVETRSETAYLAIGLPLKATIRSESRMAAGVKVVTEIETHLVVGTGTETPEEGPTTLEGLRAQLESAMDEGDIETAVRAATKITELTPKDADAWFTLAELVESQGMEEASDGTTPHAALLFIEAGKAFRKFAKLAIPERLEERQGFAAYVYYNEACGHALTGSPAKAVKSLGRAIEAGFTDLEHIQSDPDLDSLRDREDFKALIEAVPGMATEGAREEVAKLLAENETFEFDFELQTIDDQTVRLSDLRGKVVIVDFWGTWCPPCRREIPHFVALHKQYKDAGLAIVGLNYEGVEADEARTKIAEFAKANGIEYPCLLGDEKTRDQVPNFEGYPTTLFIDRTGKVRLKVVGYHEKPFLEAAVQALLEEKVD